VGPDVLSRRSVNAVRFSLWESVMMSSRPERPGFTLVELLVVIAIIAVLVGMLLPAVQMVRASAARVKCQNNLKQMGLGLCDYEVAMGGFPASCTTSDPSNPPAAVNRVNSWTVYILPYVEQGNLANEYYFVNPLNGMPLVDGQGQLNGWENQFNWPAVRTQVALFNCPSTPNQPRTDNDTNTPQSLIQAACGDYGAVSAIKPFVGTGCFNTTSQNPDDITFAGGMTYDQVTPEAAFLDGTSNTILVAEDAGRGDFYITGSKIVPNTIVKGQGGWADPNGAFAIDGSDRQTGAINSMASQVATSCAVNCSNNSEIYSFHPAGANVVFADGSVHFLRQSMSVCVLAALTTRAGGEEIGDY
jgi:prepilin-type N-terminal cleavage/methylation domain-containing protein/prepilin-type processing-associated H-X9-DG protein